MADNDPRSDIYSLGATLFEFLTGQPPFVADTPEETMQMHLTAPIPDIQTFRPDVSIQTASLLKRMLAKNPAERVPSAQTVIDGLRRILAMKHQNELAATQAPAPAPPAPPPRRMMPRRSGSGGHGRPGTRPKPRGRR